MARLVVLAHSFGTSIPVRLTLAGLLTVLLPCDVDALEGGSLEPATATSTEKQAEENRQREADEAKRLTELFLRNQRVFLRKNELMVELNTFYNRNSREDFLPQTPFLAKHTTQFIDASLVIRYGILTDGLELNLRSPLFVHAEQETDLGIQRAKRVEDGMGDLRAALRYQVWYETGNRPGLVLDVSGKSTTGGDDLTGTGTWNVGGGATLLKSMDPVVLFGRLGYTYNFAGEGRDLGNIVDYQLGMGFSLNDRVSFNIQFTGAHIAASQFTTTAPIGGGGAFGPLVASTQSIDTMNIVFTTTVSITKRFFVEPLVGVGLTDHSFTIVGIRLPYRFDFKQ